MNTKTTLLNQVFEQRSGRKSSERFEYHFIHPNTGNKMTLKLAEEDFSNWESNMLIQRAMPYLDSDEREFLISGFLPGECGVFG